MSNTFFMKPLVFLVGLIGYMYLANALSPLIGVDPWWLMMLPAIVFCFYATSKA